MKNISYFNLKQESTYSMKDTTFYIKHSNPDKEPRLYLTQFIKTEKSSDDKFRSNCSIFNLDQYNDYVLDDIHITVQPEFESAKNKGKKNSNPFHITLVFLNSKDCLVIHDFYSALDLSRDFHIQLHSTDNKGDPTIIYLANSIINLNQLNLLIDKEIALVQALIEKNNSYEQDLIKSIKSKEEELFSIAAQASNFNLDTNDYEHFLASLKIMIDKLENLVDLGYERETRRLENFKSELKRWEDNNAVNQDAFQVHQGLLAEQVTAREESPNLMSNEKIKSKSSKSKSGSTRSRKKVKTKISVNVKSEIDTFLNDYYQSTNTLNDQKSEFLKQIDQLLNDNDFKSTEFLLFCEKNQDLFSQLWISEAEEFVLKFFRQFAMCKLPEDQITCKNIATFLSAVIPGFRRYMFKVSKNYHRYDNDHYVMSGILLAYMHNNVSYWEYMHEYGMSFSGNDHVMYKGTVGNILHGMLIILCFLPESIDYFIPYLKRLFQYLEENNEILSPMKLYNAVLTVDRKVVHRSVFFKEDKNASSEMDDMSRRYERFKEEIRTEPFGTIILMRSIQHWCLQAYQQALYEKKEPDEMGLTFMPKLVDAFEILAPYVTTELLLKSFEDLLAMQYMEILRDHSHDKLLVEAKEPALSLLSQFELEYAAYGYYIEPMSRLLQCFMTVLTTRMYAMSSTEISNLMQTYFQQAKTAEQELYSLAEKNNPKLPISRAMIKIEKYKQLALARIAYFFFTIKVKREIHLTVDDFSVMLYFNRCYFADRVSLFSKGESGYDHQLNVSFFLTERLVAAIEQLELKTEIIDSEEYQNLVDEVLKREKDASTIAFP